MRKSTRRGVRTRKLAMWSALCPVPRRESARFVPSSSAKWTACCQGASGELTFLDGFLGGGSVSIYAKAQGFRVVATDIAERAIVVGKALIENSRVRLTREDVLRLAAPTDDPPGRIEQKYAPSTFTAPQARLLDRALVVAKTRATRPRAALLRLLAIRVALLAHPMSQVRAGTIHRFHAGEYESITESCVLPLLDGLRLTRPEKLWELAQQINAGVFEGEARVHPGERPRHAARDPGRRRLLRSAVPRRHVATSGSTRSSTRSWRARPARPVPSPRGTAPRCSTRSSSGRMHIPVWLLSPRQRRGRDRGTGGEDGPPRPGDPGDRDQVPAPAGGGDRGEEGERTGSSWSSGGIPRHRSSGRPSVQGHRAGAGVDHTDGEAVVHEDARLGGAELPAFAPGLGDRSKEGEPGLAEEVAVGFGHAIPVADDRALMIQTPSALNPASTSTVKGESSSRWLMATTFPWQAAASQGCEPARRRRPRD